MRLRAGLLLALIALSGGGCEYESPAPVKSPADRIVTLAPHLAELMFAIGAGDLVVGVSAWSDYPPAVVGLPVVGDAFTIDHEQLALAEPDLLLAWESGMPAHIVDELRDVGYRVEVIRTRSLDDVSAAMLRLGELVGRKAQAKEAVSAFDSSIEALRGAYSDAEPIRVYYQVSARPLFTVSGEHFISGLIMLCGGRNVFADLEDLAPAVSEEAVIAADPELMLATDASSGNPFAEWQRWPGIAANRYGNHFRIGANSSSRATPRLTEAALDICAALDRGRQNRAYARSRSQRTS